MSIEGRPWLLRYGFALGTVVVATLVRRWLSPVLLDRSPYSLVIMAVAFSAWFGGVRPALVALILGWASAMFFIVGPHGSPWDLEPTRQVGFVILALTGLVIALLGGSMRAAQEHAATSALDAERALEAERAIREQLRTTLNCIGDAVIVTDNAGHVTLFNPVAEEITGWDAADAAGRPLAEVFPLGGGATRDAGANAAAELARAATAELANHAVLTTKAGERRPVEVNAATIQDEASAIHGVVLVFRDVTERRRAEESLRESERSLRRLADTMPQIVWTAAREGGVDYFNARWYEYTGMTPEASLAHEGWKGAVHPEDVAALFSVRNRAVEEGAFFEAEVRMRAGDGSYRWHLVRSIPVRDEAAQVIRRYGTATDIDDRKRAEERLRESEQRFTRFMQHLPGLAWAKDQGGHYVFANDAAVKAFRIPREDLYGKTDDEIFPAETAARFRENDRRALGSGTGIQVIETLEHEDRTIHHSIVNKFPIAGPDGGAALIGGIAIDITELKRAEEALRRSEELFRTLADSIPQLAWMARGDGTIFWYNRRWYEYTGKTPDQMEGWDWHSVLDPAELPRMLAGFKAAVDAGRPWEETFRLRARDGAVRWHLSRALPVRDDQGRVVRWFGTHTDITERIQLEAALKEAGRRKDEFLATLAHELRNPLAPIRNALHLLDRPGSDPQLKAELRSVMKRQVDHMSRLVDDLLDVSRITQGKVELRKEEIDLATVIARSVEASRPQIEDRGQELIVSSGPEPTYLLADPTRLEQVLDNLLNNAAKYTDPGGRIWLTVRRSGASAEIRVRDTGIGIEAESLPHIFDLFMQAERRLDRSQGGLGIGLSLVRSLTELHGGAVAARSEGLGLGSEFIVTLPALPARSAPGPRAEAAAARPPGRSIPRRRVLVVDDNIDSARTMSLLLRRSWGQEVEVAHDGAAAIEAANTFLPEVILLDIGLPGMDGYEVARCVRKRPEFDKTVIVAMTGWGQEDDRRRSREAGMDHHLVKPVNPDDLQRLLVEIGEAR